MPLKRLINCLFVLLVSLVFLAPMAWMASASIKPDETIHRDVQSLRSFAPYPATLANVQSAAHRGHLGTVLLNTIVVVVVIAVGGLLVNTPAAYAFAKMRFAGNELIFTLLISTIIIPLEAIVIPLFMTVRVGHGLTDVVGVRAWTLAGLSVPFMAKAFNIFLLRQAFLALPRSLQEAAFIDGVGHWGVFWHVALPNIKPALVTVVLVDCVVHWGDFIWPLVLCQQENTRTVQLGLANFFTQPPISWGAIFAYALLASLPVMIIFLVAQKWIVQSLTTTGTKG